MDPLVVIVLLAVLAVLVILMVGVLSFGKGGPWHDRNANRVMRWRIYAQAAAVVLILIVVAIRQASH